MKRRRQFWIREIKDFMGMPGLNVYDTDLKCGDIHVREVLPGEDDMIKELVSLVEETLAQIDFPEHRGYIKQINEKALDKYKKWIGQ